jgi:hypothetical protein
MPNIINTQLTFVILIASPSPSVGADLVGPLNVANCWPVWASNWRRRPSAELPTKRVPFGVEANEDIGPFGHSIWANGVEEKAPDGVGKMCRQMTKWSAPNEANRMEEEEEGEGEVKKLSQRMGARWSFKVSKWEYWLLQS